MQLCLEGAEKLRNCFGDGVIAQAMELENSHFLNN